MLLTIKAEPVAKARARTVMRGGKVWSFTPTKTKKAGDELTMLIREQIAESYPQHTPLILSVTFYRTKPVYVPKDDSMPVRKPDLSNLIKTVEDALNTIAFPDDAQITTLHASKRWAEDGNGYITIELIEDKL